MRPRRSIRREGYTLLELLIAMSLLIVLGGGLVAFLNQGISIWRISERRGREYERARALLDGVAADLRSTVACPRGKGHDSWTRFVADRDPTGRQRLRFVRTTSGESSDAILREGGRLLSTRTPAHFDGIADTLEADAGLLAAPGGTQEVFYMQDPRPRSALIWRGTRSPVGGPGSLLVDRNVEGELPEPPPKEKPGAPGNEPEAAPEKKPIDAAAIMGVRKKDEQMPPPEWLAEIEDLYLSDVAVPVARDVLYIGFRFWGPHTNTWDDVPPREVARPGEKSGPELTWDSTRGSSGGRSTAVETLSSDDRLPERVEIVVVVGSLDDVPDATLLERVGERGERLALSEDIELPSDPRDRYVLVDDEWIAVAEAAGRTWKVADDGRGRRWTAAARHALGAPVRTGRTFRRVVDIPGYRVSAQDLESSAAQPERRRAFRPRGR